MKPFSDRIGFIPTERSFKFDGATLVPLDSYQELVTWVQQQTHTDGYFYPPATYTERVRHEVVDGERRELRERLPNSDRPALLFRMPASHELKIERPTKTADLRLWDAGFVTNSIAFVRVRRSSRIRHGTSKSPGVLGPARSACGARERPAAERRHSDSTPREARLSRALRQRFAFPGSSVGYPLTLRRLVDRRSYPYSEASRLRGNTRRNGGIPGAVL